MIQSIVSSMAIPAYRATFVLLIVAGVSALLKGLDIRLREETELPIILAEDPLRCVAKGAGKALGELKLLRQISLKD